MLKPSNAADAEGSIAAEFSSDGENNLERRGPPERARNSGAFTSRKIPVWKDVDPFGIRRQHIV